MYSINFIVFAENQMDIIQLCKSAMNHMQLDQFDDLQCCVNQLGLATTTFVQARKEEIATQEHMAQLERGIK